MAVQQRFDGYGSHIPVLETIRSITNFSNILEFGGGDFSTKYFMSIPGARVTTIESQSRDWFEHLLTINPNTLWIPDHQEVIEYAQSFNQSRDIVLLDTHQDLRYKLAPIVRKYSMVTVLHDSETSLYKYDQIDMENGKYLFCDCVIHRPWTMVMCEYKELLMRVLNNIPGILYNNMDSKIYLADI